MAQFKTFFARIQLGTRRSSNVTKIVVAVSIVLCTISLITLRISTTELKNRTESLSGRAAILEQNNLDLETRIANLGSVQSVVDIAQTELGLVQPGAIFYQPES